MPSPLPIELRKRIVAAYLNGEGSYKVLAARFSVGEASVNRLIARHKRTGDIAPSPMGGARHIHKIDEAGLAYIKALLEEDPTWTRGELCAEYEDEFGVVVAEATMGRARKRLGFTRKRGF